MSRESKLISPLFSCRTRNEPPEDFIKPTRTVWRSRSASVSVMEKRGDGDDGFAGVGGLEFEAGEMDGGVGNLQVKHVGDGIVLVIGGDIHRAVGDFETG